MDCIQKVTLAVASVCFGAGILITHQTGRLYPELPIAMTLAVLALAVPLFITRSETKISHVVLAATVLAVMYRVFVFVYPASMVGLDPDGVAISVDQIVASGTLRPVESVFFYNSAPGSFVFTSVYSVVADVPASDGFVVLAVCLGIAAPLFSALTTGQLFDQHHPAVGVAAIGGSVGATSIRFGTAVNAQTLSVVLMFLIVFVLVTVVARANDRTFILGILALVLLMFTHKIALFVPLLMVGPFAVVAVLSSRFGLPPEIEFQDTVSLVTNVTLLLGLMLFLQWFEITPFFRSVLVKVEVLVNTVLLQGSVSAPTATVDPTLATTPYSGLIGTAQRYLYALGLMAVAGLGWVVLSITRYRERRPQLLLVAGAMAVGAISLSAITSGTSTPQRLLSYTEVVLVVLAAVPIGVSVTRRSKAVKTAGAVDLAALVISQLFTAAAVPDRPDTRGRMYLTDQEVAGKAHVMDHVNGQAHTDAYYARETIPSAFHLGTAANQQFATLNQGLLNGTIHEKNHSHVLWRDGTRIVRTGSGLWRLEWDPTTTLRTNYNTVYDNCDVKLYAKPESNTTT
jgi:hypothetical protein